jgi:hypothetical protein
MSELHDLFDVVCALDDCADWLEGADDPASAAQLRTVSDDLKGRIVLRLVDREDPA